MFIAMETPLHCRRLDVKKTQTTVKKLPSLLNFCFHVLGLWHGTTQWIDKDQPDGGNHCDEDQNGNKEAETHFVGRMQEYRK